MMALYTRKFNNDLVDEALDRLHGSQLDRDERRAIEMRLLEMQKYEGFTCEIELSFDHAQRTYILDLRTEWFDELRELIGRIEESFEEPDEQSPLSGYFSNN